MYCEKDCYFCRYLCFFDVGSVNEYFCTLRGIAYRKTKQEADCENYVPDMEE